MNYAKFDNDGFLSLAYAFVLEPTADLIEITAEQYEYAASGGVLKLDIDGATTTVREATEKELSERESQREAEYLAGLTPLEIELYHLEKANPLFVDSMNLMFNDIRRAEDAKLKLELLNQLINLGGN